jgi:hypothetical protein
MKNVTITLDDAIASRARVEAASRGQSLSKFVGEFIEREIERKVERKEMTDLEGIRDFLSGPGIPATATPDRFPIRQEICDERIDELVRRYELAHLCGPTSCSE